MEIHQPLTTIDCLCRVRSELQCIKQHGLTVEKRICGTLFYMEAFGDKAINKYQILIISALSTILNSRAFLTSLYYCTAVYFVISCLHITSKLTAIHLVVRSVPCVILFASLFFRFYTDDSSLSVISLNHCLLTYLRIGDW